jgi:hypothetical protein
MEESSLEVALNSKGLFCADFHATRNVRENAMDGTKADEITIARSIMKSTLYIEA